MHICLYAFTHEHKYRDNTYLYYIDLYLLYPFQYIDLLTLPSNSTMQLWNAIFWIKLFKPWPGKLLTTANLLLGKDRAALCHRKLKICSRCLVDKLSYLQTRSEVKYFWSRSPNNTVFPVMPLDYMQNLSGTLEKETLLKLFVKMTGDTLWKVFQKEFWTIGSCTIIWD